MVLVGISVGCLMGPFFGHARHDGKTAPLKGPLRGLWTVNNRVEIAAEIASVDFRIANCGSAAGTPKFGKE